jgi:hypothetical protein
MRTEARARGAEMTIVSALLLALFVSALVWGFLTFRSWARDAIDSPEVHTYNGVTWVDDSCHIDDEGTLWCTARG